MEREVSITTELAVTIVASVAFLSIVLVTVSLIGGVKDDAASKMVDIKNETTEGYLHDLSKNDLEMNSMPIAAIYGLIKNYESSIVSVTVGLNDSTTSNVYVPAGEHDRVVDVLHDENPLQYHLGGRARLDVWNNMGQFHLFVHSDECTDTYCVCEIGSKDLEGVVKTRYDVH